MTYFCCDELRRKAVRDQGTLNGIDYLEVAEDQTHLELHLLNTLGCPLTGRQIVIEGGERIRDVGIELVEPATAAKVLALTLNRWGDFSTYRLRLVAGPENDAVPAQFDPALAAVEFSFKVNCPANFDCRPERSCPQPVPEPPPINYLAKDYATFRQLLLDRMALIAPDWQERNAADAGIALVELLAYVGDQLSYRQDAVATEAYLGTARRRTSVRRLARLVDYVMHDGCNSRVWLHFTVSAEVTVPQGTACATKLEGQDVAIDPAGLDWESIKDSCEVFQTMQDATLCPAHNELEFHTWSDDRCCLPEGSVRATLRNEGGGLRLQPGDILIFEEVRGPKTGVPADADPAHRHAVRLTQVSYTTDPPYREKADPTQELRVVNIEWAREDALPFPLCLWRVKASEGGIRPVSVGRGNVILADHGRTVTDADLGEVEDATIFRPPDTGSDPCSAAEAEPVLPRYRPELSERPLTFAAPTAEELLFSVDCEASWVAELNLGRLPQGLRSRLARQHVVFPPGAPLVQGRDTRWWLTDETQGCVLRRVGGELHCCRFPAPATRAGRTELPAALPAVAALTDSDGTSWQVKRDLLLSGEADTDCVVEVETDGTARLRFGDGEHGRRPEPGTRFRATYRVGNGRRGDVGADKVVHVISSLGDVRSRTAGVRNPLPARGGVEPETMGSVRQSAPVAFRRQERAVNAADYAAVAERQSQVQRAQASFRWTGSWHTVFVTLDRVGGYESDEPFKACMLEELDRHRLAGFDVALDAPRFVALEIEFQVCVKPGYFRSDVERNLRRVFSSGLRPCGRQGVFHPDNFTFGRPVYLSPLYAAAQAVAGVESVRCTKFERWGEPNPAAIDQGRLDFARLEIARLDNDPNFPEHGVFNLRMEGGQ